MKFNELTQAAITEINKGIPFVDAKLYWREGFGWTSQYWDNLYRDGWRMVKSEDDPDTLLVKNEKGAIIFSAGNELELFKLLVNFLVGGG
ncbi:MAG: hypothetical protein LBK98_08865 [Peptococcaceae bacterium]|jgi:hypothetical protein|nr:hypothetical protein [Peptococcaceae bacterium]